MSRPEGFFRKHEPVLVNLLNAFDATTLTAVAATQHQEHPAIALIGGAFALANLYAIGLETRELSHHNQALAAQLERRKVTPITPHRGPIRKREGPPHAS